MYFRGSTEELVLAEIDIEKVRRRIRRAESPVRLESGYFTLYGDTSGKHSLKEVSCDDLLPYALHSATVPFRVSLVGGTTGILALVALQVVEVEIVDPALRFRERLLRGDAVRRAEEGGNPGRIDRDLPPLSE